MIKEMWLDARKYSEQDWKVLVPLATNNGFIGVLFNINQLKYIKMIPQSVKKLLYLNSKNEFDSSKIAEHLDLNDLILFSDKIETISDIKNIKKGLFLNVNDKESLDIAVNNTKNFSNIIIEFTAPTNIPLELVLAFSQHNKCNICKAVNVGEDGWIASMVMEMGCHEVLLSTKKEEDILHLKDEMELSENKKIEIQELTVTETKHIGMGDRVCIDTTSLLKEDEGMILGSTSGGGILVSSETHFLPYMELRPFRVNAGGIHMYAWNMNDKTDYLSELRAGNSLMTVDSKGNVRRAAVGRIKIERRPLILIKAKDNKDNEVNVILQDDWHVRVIGPNGKPLNCTELKLGDKVLGYICNSGRHMGVKIDENIIER